MASLTYGHKMKKVFSNIDSASHILYLHAPSIDTFSFQASFLTGRKGKTAYVTCQPAAGIEEKFNSLKNLSVVHPENMDDILKYNTVIVDASTISKDPTIPNGSVHVRRKIGVAELTHKYFTIIQREKYLNDLKNKNILCSYDVSTLPSKTLEILARYHDKLILTAEDTAVVSTEGLSSQNLNVKPELIDEFLKNELETVILSLLCSQSLCGTDIKKIIHKKFNILLSSGTMYPLLHKLEKAGMLKCEPGVKTKMYRVVEKSAIGNMLNERLQAKNFLSQFIQANMGLRGENK